MSLQLLQYFTIYLIDDFSFNLFLFQWFKNWMEKMLVSKQSSILPIYCLEKAQNGHVLNNLRFFIQDTISIDGAIRVLSDEFSIALLNPEQPAYREKAEKYSFMVSYKTH